MAAAVLALAGVLYTIARETSMFAVSRIEVTGAPRPVARQVEAALRRFDGASLVSLDGSRVVGTVEELPTVVSATYDRAFPHGLVVRVVPEQPVAVLRSGASSWLVSERGRVIETLARSRFATLPRIWLPPRARVEVGAFLDGDAGAAARALRAFVSAGLARHALWARLRGGLLTVALRSGLELRFGPPSDLDLKVAVARAILPTMQARSAGGPAYLDVSVPERPVAGSNPQPAGRG